MRRSAGHGRGQQQREMVEEDRRSHSNSQFEMELSTKTGQPEWNCLSGSNSVSDFQT